MRTRRLGRTGLEVGEIGLGGAWLLGRDGRAPVESGVATVRRALELGVTYIDTAECYIGGKSEAVIGKALDGVQTSAVVATKFGHRPADHDLSRDAVLASAEESLRLLRRPSMDIFQLHTPAEPPWERVFGPGGAVEGMIEARERGWCRFLGITGRDIDFLRRCIETDVFDTLLVFMRYDLLDQSASELFDEAHARDMGVIQASPLRMGLFGSARDSMEGGLQESERRQMEALDVLLADEPGGLSGAAMRFALSHPAVSVALSGATSAADIENIVEVSAGSMSAELVAAIRATSSA